MSERDKFIHEKIMGLCVHDFSTTDWKDHGNLKQCTKCAQWLPWHVERNPSYSTNWQDYGELIKHCKKQRWWGYLTEYEISEDLTELATIISDPDHGSLAIARFNGWEGE